MKSKFSSSPDVRLIRRLRAVGCPMPSDRTEEQPCELKAEVTKSEITVSYDRRGGTECVFGIRLTNVSYARLDVHRFRGHLPGLPGLTFLGDCRAYSPEAEYYRLESGRRFPYDDVINHCVGEKGALEPGAHLEGVLLAYTMFQHIPAEYVHRDTAIATIFVEDQFGRKHRSEVEISVDRSATMRLLVPNPRPEPLFEERIPEQSDTELRKIATPEETQPRAAQVQ